jgi:hypothetical protein
MRLYSRQLQTMRKYADSTQQHDDSSDWHGSFERANVEVQHDTCCRRFSSDVARTCALTSVICFTSDWFQVLSSGIPIASVTVMRITMTLTRRNGQLVALGQNEAVRILLARSDHEMRQHIQSRSEQSFFVRLTRIFIALAQTAFPLHR